MLQPSSLIEPVGPSNGYTLSFRRDHSTQAASTVPLLTGRTANRCPTQSLTARVLHPPRMRPFGLARCSFSDLQPLHLQAVDAKVDLIGFRIHEVSFASLLAAVFRGPIVQKRRVQVGMQELGLATGVQKWWNSTVWASVPWTLRCAYFVGASSTLNVVVPFACAPIEGHLLVVVSKRRATGNYAWGFIQFPIGNDDSRQCIRNPPNFCRLIDTIG